MSETQCLRCPSPALFEETLFCDWGRRDGTTEAFRIPACEAHRVDVREQLVRVFKRHPNPLVGGSIIHLVRTPDGVRMLVWSDLQDFRSWAKAGKIAANTRPSNGAFREIFGSPRHVSRCDWRGWGTHRKPHETYLLPPREVAEYTRPFLEQFARRWVQQLPPDWTPRYEQRLPF